MEQTTPPQHDIITPMEEGTIEVTAIHDLIAGGIAGSASVVVGHPFDTIKVRMQTGVGGGSSSMLSSFGGISSLFRGMAAPLSTAAIVNAIIFSSYGASSRLWDENVGLDEQGITNHDPWQKAFCCGSFAGLVQAVVICPMEHIKCRLQVQHGKGMPDYLYKGPYQVASHIVKDHGVMRGLYRGWWCTTIREVPAFGAYFAIYDAVKDWVTVRLEEGGHEGNPHTWLASAFAGGVTGCITWAAIYPVDVIKTRIQTSPLDSQVRMMQVGRDLVRQHGWNIMFRGLGVTMVRAFPVNGIIFPCYEFVLKQMTTEFN